MWIRSLTTASAAGMPVAFGVYWWRRHTELEHEVAERKKAQEALRQNELRLRTLVANAPGVLFALNGDGVVTMLEGQGLKAFGREQNELVGQSIFDLHCDKPMLLELARRALAGEEIDKAIELAGVTLGVRSFSLRDDAGKVSGVVGVAIDDTERRQAAEALQESEQRFRALFEQFGDALLVHDEAGRIVDCNAEACRSLGYSREELLSLSVKDFAAELASGEEQLSESGMLWRDTTPHELDAVVAGFHLAEHRRKDGTTFPVEVRVIHVDYDGKRMMLASARDNADQPTHAKGPSEESERWMRAAMQNSSDFVMILETDANIRYVSPAVERVLGYRPEDLVGTRALDYIHPEDLEYISKSFAEAVEKPGVQPPIEYRVRAADGSWRHMEAIRSNCLDDPDVAGLVANVRDITERKQAEERFRSLVQNSSDVITIVDADGTILYDSPAVERVLGYKPEERAGTSAFDYIGPSESEQVTRMLEELLASPGSRLTGEMWWPHKDGTSRYLEVTPNNLLDDPAVGGILVNWRDITERKRAEEALRESEERFRSTFDEAAIGMTMNDLDGRFLQVNRSLCEMFGYSQEELLATTFLDIVPPDDLVESRDRMGRMLAGEVNSFQAERRCLHAEGHVVWVSLSSSVVRDPEGHPLYFIGQLQDITQRKKVEEALKESEERYRAIIEQTIDSVYLGNVDTKYVIESNTAFQQMLGYTAEELRGMRIYDFVAHEKEDIDTVYQSVFEAGQHFIGERRYRRKDGTVVEVEASATVISYGGERVMCMVARDVTERKEFEEKLLETNRRLEELAVLKADFTTMVAHELYSPLVTARGYLDMLATGELEPIEQRHALDGMRSELEMLGALVADARVAASIERDDFAIQPSRVPVSALLDDAVAFAEMLPGDHRLFVKAEAREQEVWADRYRVGQVLRNLLSNAANYSPDGAPIELRTRVDGDHICIEVADRGHGIHPDDASRIFEKFGRGRDPSGRRVAGVGVGLYLSRRIMKAHGGDLMMDSTPGTGSVFGFKLRIIR